ncbi:IS110 family transposase [Nocardioides panzhihuensis]|uniref:Transposase n=1 Tax=Nocardioides panzhihuensis TaxID=860243 RepID=A0A7Z0DM56_9ACTN|nr:IS110 family transposase [Nocardioides panzhihuensis]NYI76137.1 transposase [Nocardioides panzhihuensis]NYI76189.1 transposase [Nocardioides panzhihuensis]NYI76916.1 transposase [Nocardioides panzhihuensis]NYI77993.1 transposase [Nocardioides panzhihuensis]NYI78758.1 transposase [Nocardioides panzhihuensis]
MTNRSEDREVIGGVDTHGATHHCAALDARTGKLLGDSEFPATAKGYAQALKWLQRYGRVEAVGVEGTGSYGAGLTRYLTSRDVVVIEVVRANRQARYLQGKSDPLDAINAARAVLAGMATTVPKTRNGNVEAIRMIQTTRRSASKARKAAINQMHGLIYSAPEPLREQLRGLNRAALVARCLRLRPTTSTQSGELTVIAKTMLRRLARRVQALDEEIEEANQQLTELVQHAAPALLQVFGAGPEAAAQLLTTAGENRDRISTEASLARLCGVAPIPASSGNTTRHRLHRGGDRRANSAIHMIIINRLRWHEPTKAYVTRRTAEGKTKSEIIRCLKRAAVRELYRALLTDLNKPAAEHEPAA